MKKENVRGADLQDKAGGGRQPVRPTVMGLLCWSFCELQLPPPLFLQCPVSNYLAPTRLGQISVISLNICQTLKTLPAGHL